MKAKKSVITVTGLIILFLLLATYILLQRPLWTEPEIISTVHAPDSQYTAYIYKSRKITREEETYHVSISRSSRPPRGGGNVYQSNICPNLIKWKINNDYMFALLVNNYAAESVTPKIYKCETNVMRVRIKYTENWA